MRFYAFFFIYIFISIYPMQRETNDHLKKVIEAISAVLEENKIPSTPDNIVKYTSTTIRRLLDTTQHDKHHVKDLLSVLLVFQDFLEDEEELITRLIEGEYKAQALRILRVLYSKGRHVEIYAKYFEVPVDVVNKLGDEEFVRVALKRFDPQMNWKERELPKEDVLKIMYEYTTSGSTISCEDVKYMMEFLKSSPPSPLALRILGNLLHANPNDQESLLSLHHLVRGLIFSEETSVKEVMEFFSKARHILIPTFIDIIRDLCKEKEKWTPVLRVIACHLGVLELLTISEDQDMAGWIPILKGTSNNDLSLFLRIHREVNAFVLLPSFCDYPTDSYGLVGEFLQVLLEALRDPSYYSLGVSGLRNIIHSHELNVSKELILRSSIPREDSLRILKAVYQPEVFYGVLGGYEDGEVSRGVLLKMSSKLALRDELKETGEKLLEYVYTPSSSPLVIHTSSRSGNGTINLPTTTLIISNVKDSLNLLKFFIPCLNFPLDFPSKLLEISDTIGPKKPWELIYYLEMNGKMPLCLCGHLVDSPGKYPLLYLSLVFKKECHCEVDKVDLLYHSIILSSSSTTRRVALDILETIILPTHFSPFLTFLSTSLGANSMDIVSGALSIFSYLLHYSRNIPGDTQASFYSFILKSYISLPTLVVLQSLKAFLKYTHLSHGVAPILEHFVDARRKKYRADIKELVHILLKKGLPVSRKLKRYTNFRIPTTPHTLTITKNDEIIIAEEKQK